MAVRAKDNQVIWLVAPSFGLFHDVVNFETLLGANRAPMTRLNEELISHCFRNGHRLPHETIAACRHNDLRISYKRLARPALTYVPLNRHRSAAFN